MACMVFVAKGQIRHYKNEKKLLFSKSHFIFANEIINFSFMQTLNFLKICHNIGYSYENILHM
jgi:hypothetical protein